MSERCEKIANVVRGEPSVLFEQAFGCEVVPTDNVGVGQVVLDELVELVLCRRQRELLAVRSFATDDIVAAAAAAAVLVRPSLLNARDAELPRMLATLARSNGRCCSFSSGGTRRLRARRQLLCATVRHRRRRRRR